MTSKFSWRTFRTIPHKAVCSRKTYRVEKEFDKDIVLRQISDYLKGVPHTCSVFETSVNHDILELELIILVEGSIHEQQKKTEYIRSGIDNIIGKHTAN